jgi:hypothetical protein
MVGELLHGGLGDEDVNLTTQCVLGNGEVGGVGGEDGDGVAGGEGIDGRLVCEGKRRQGRAVSPLRQTRSRTIPLDSQASASLTPGAG